MVMLMLLVIVSAGYVAYDQASDLANDDEKIEDYNSKLNKRWQKIKAAPLVGASISESLNSTNGTLSEDLAEMGLLSKDSQVSDLIGDMVASVGGLLATAIFPLNTPARKRAIRAINKVFASPNIVKNTVLPTSPIIRTGLRPIRSDRAPHIGENRNWAAEYEVIKRPTQIPIEAASCSPAKSSTRYVRNGMTIPKPIISIIVTRKSTNKAPLLASTRRVSLSSMFKARKPYLSIR